MQANLADSAKSQYCQHVPLLLIFICFIPVSISKWRKANALSLVGLSPNFYFITLLCKWNKAFVIKSRAGC